MAAVFAVVNVAAGRSSLYTAALLSGALFYGITDPAMVSIALSPILAYTAVHLVVFLVFGMLAVGLAKFADRGWHLWYMALFFFIFVSFHLFGAVQAFTAAIQPALPDVMVWVAGIAAGLMMAAYILLAHPAMRAKQSW